MAEHPNITPLRQWRVSAGLTIRQLEAATGINRGRLSILERGVTPTAAEMARITEALRRPDLDPAA